MGGKNTKDARTKELEKAMAQDFQKDSMINKLLLLGAGESGKSTLFKQMITIYGKGYTDEERQEYVGAIHRNAIEAMQELIKQAPNYSDGIASLQGSVDALMEVKEDMVVTPAIAGHIQKLWADGNIQKTYDERANYQLPDSAKYYFSKIDKVADPKFLPDDQDILRSRVRTTGIVENSFAIDGNDFRMYDVGGQRSERKKWIHCFEDVTAVLFVAAISEYDQVCYEDSTTNRVEEAMSLFDQICNSEWFTNVSVVLFLNKRDLFEQKLPKVPLKTFFKDYPGDNSYEDAANYVQWQFVQLNKCDKKIYPHVTCATDTSNVAAVFQAVKDIIITSSLAGSGLM